MVKLAALDICSKKNTRESLVGTFKNICTVAAHYWYIKYAFAGFYQQIFQAKKSEDILGEINKKAFVIGY